MAKRLDMVDSQFSVVIFFAEYFLLLQFSTCVLNIFLDIFGWIREGSFGSLGTVVCNQIWIWDSSQFLGGLFVIIFFCVFLHRYFPKHSSRYFGQIRKGSQFWVSWHVGGGLVHKSRTIHLILQGSSHTRSLSPFSKMIRIYQDSLQSFTIKIGNNLAIVLSNNV